MTKIKVIGLALVAALTAQTAWLQMGYAADATAAALLNNKGVMSLRNSDYAQAITYFEQALAANSEYTLARRNLAIAYNNYALTYREKDPLIGLAYFCKSFKINPDNATTSQNILGMIRLLAKNARSKADITELASRMQARGQTDAADFLRTMDVSQLKLPAVDVRSVTFTQNGKTLLSWSEGASDNIMIWNLETKTVIRTISPDSTVVGLAVSADEHTLATSHEDGVGIWNMSSVKLQRTIPSKEPHGVALSPDGALLATAGKDGIKLWDTKSGAIVRTLSSTASMMPQFTDSHTLMTMDKASIALWDTSSGKQVATLKDDLHPDDLILSMAYCGNGEMLATTAFHHGTSPIISIWDIKARSRTKELPPPNGPSPPHCLTISEQCTSVACGVASSVAIWDLASGEKIVDIPLQQGPVSAVAFNPDGNILASGGAGTIRLWRVSDLKKEKNDATDAMITSIDVPTAATPN